MSQLTSACDYWIIKNLGFWVSFICSGIFNLLTSQKSCKKISNFGPHLAFILDFRVLNHCAFYWLNGISFMLHGYRKVFALLFLG